MAVHDDAIAAYLGAIHRGTLYGDSRGAYHGSLAGASWVASGVIGRPVVSVSVPSSQYAYANFGSNLSLSEFSLSCWFRFDSAPSLATILFCGSPSMAWSSGSAWIHADVSSGVISALSFRSASQQTRKTGLNLPASQWHHVGAARFASGATQLYVNGALDASGTMASVPDISGALVARGGNNPLYSSSGEFADVSLWGRVLSASEFATLANPRYRPLGTGRSGFPLSRLVN